MRLPHILRCHEPLLQGGSRTVLCGKKIEDARFSLSIAGDISGKMTLSAEDFCVKCAVIANSTPTDDRYVYGVFPASWIRESEEQR